MNLIIFFLIFILIIILLCKLNENFNSNNISKVIYLSHKESIPNFVIKSWKKLNPNYKIKFYNDKDCRKFIKENYPQSYLDYFDRLSNYKGSGPIKCDFWRCLILYKYGGVYADSDIEPLIPIDEFLEKDTDFLTCNSYYKNSFNPHFIYVSSKKDKILELCIEYYEKNLFDKPYSYWDHSIVRVMENIWQTNNIIKKEYEDQIIYNTSLIPNKTYKIQLLKEVFPNRQMRSSNAYCSYKNKKILNNRTKNYDPYNHSFKKSNSIINHILNFFSNL